MPDNTVTIVGNLTRDPEQVNTSTGTVVVRFSVAVNHRRQIGGQWEDEPNFFDCVIFGDAAMNLMDSCKIGDRVIVNGRMKWSSWETDGQKRSKIEVVVDEVGPSLRWATATPSKVDKNKAAVSHGVKTPMPADFKLPPRQWPVDEEPF